VEGNGWSDEVELFAVKGNVFCFLPEVLVGEGEKAQARDASVSDQPGIISIGGDVSRATKL
jgi:hypothetical protein